ncbi:MAG TPA: GlsB/YeaQ/YmgE family stress response membrane protein [Nitrospiraceae bacterium]|nr:GlsB/YeaQ/YmgE family stress response membrane protein [Nitrospiraceae bacterium]
MSVLGWIVFGLIVGIVAKFLMPGRDPGGMIVTILLGVVGALVGGFIGRALGWYREGDPVGFVMAVIGAIVVLFIYRKVVGPTRADV